MRFRNAFLMEMARLPIDKILLGQVIYTGRELDALGAEPGHGRKKSILRLALPRTPGSFTFSHMRCYGPYTMIQYEKTRPRREEADGLEKTIDFGRWKVEGRWFSMCWEPTFWDCMRIAQDFALRIQTPA